jgi:phosphate transport system permease protein
MTSVDDLLASSAAHSSLATRRLPRWAPWALAAGVALVTLGLFAVTPLQGRVDYLLVLVLLFVAGWTGLSRWYEGGRKAKDRLVSSLVVTAFGLAVIPLVAILAYTVTAGVHRLDATFFTSTMRLVPPLDPGGGALHAIVGTLEQVGLASVIAVPLGVLVAIYTVEYGRGRFRTAVRYLVDVMTGLPSIVAGLFVLAFWVLALHEGYSGFAGSLALMIIMLPVVIRSSEEILKLVPDSLREASLALGIPRWKTILRIVLPTATPGMVTGIMLAVARVMGETAPVLLTVFATQDLNGNPFSGPQENLALLVFQSSDTGVSADLHRAWTGALTLIIIIMLLNLLARLVSRRFSRR